MIGKWITVTSSTFEVTEILNMQCFAVLRTTIYDDNGNTPSVSMIEIDVQSARLIIESLKEEETKRKETTSRAVEWSWRRS